ncbi:hypothetical protein N665_0418s0012 [Sinapis alba]|nr:hypothetical protein N665_0418s0012 [Sinapis alba]
MASAKYSRSEKGKWSSRPPRPSRKLPVQIPASNNVVLIEDNRLTLIGRITNPRVQKTRALVDFFLQHWHLVGTIIGRDLGPEMFKFKFDSEHDLQSVLNKAPFHFKSLPSGEVKQVELEYEKIEKYFFLCHYLSHEKDNCPSNRVDRSNPPHKIGISQAITLERLEEGRSRQDVRKHSRYNPCADNRDNRRTNHRDATQHTGGQRERSFLPQSPSESLQHYDEPRRSYNRGDVKRTQPHNKSWQSAPMHTPSGAIRSHDSRIHRDSQRSVWRRVHNPTLKGTPNHSIKSQISHTPSPKPHRENMQQDKPRTSEGSGMGDRRSALACFSALARLSCSRPSTSKNPLAVHFAPRSVVQTVSPIRSLSEDRLHVSLRLGPSPTPPHQWIISISLSQGLTWHPLLLRLLGKRKLLRPLRRKKRFVVAQSIELA